MDPQQVILPPPEPDDTGEYVPVPQEVIITPEADQPRRRGAVRRVIFGLLSLLLVLSMCLGVGGTAALDEIRQYFERREMKATLDTFMLAMAQGDTQTAYWLLAEDFQNRVPYHALEAMQRSDEFVLFSDYESLHVTSVSMTTRRSGTVIARMYGELFYVGDFQGSFSVVMVEEDGRWRLIELQIIIPPAKRDAFAGRSV